MKGHFQLFLLDDIAVKKDDSGEIFGFICGVEM